jgi:hypothetical protein
MTIRIDDHLRRMTGTVLIAHVILTSKARLAQRAGNFGRRPHAGPGDELRERRYSYKRGIKCQPTLALLLLGD